MKTVPERSSLTSVNENDCARPPHAGGGLTLEKRRSVAAVPCFDFFPAKIIVWGVLMVIVKWNRDLETGLELVDKQHRQIIESANSFFIRHKCGQDQAAASECMSFLTQYILYHFQTEEAFQVECDYPEYRQHQAMHQSVATSVKFFAVRLEASGYAQECVEEFYKFLIDWICGHILVEDVRFCQYYHQFKAGQLPFIKNGCENQKKGGSIDGYVSDEHES